MTDKALRWGLMGASDVAETQMMPALRRRGHLVTAVLSSSGPHGADYARRAGIPYSDTDPDVFLARADVDAVYVSSTNERHLEHVVAAAPAGKHVLCEKPLAPSLDDAATIVEACRAAGVVLAVNHPLPAAGPHRTVRDIVAGGGIGRPLTVAVSHPTLLPERLRGWRLGSGPGAGVVLDLTTHDVSVVNPLLGTEAIEACALTASQGPGTTATDDSVMAVVRYRDDVLVHLHSSFTTPFARTTLEIHGDRGSIRAVDVMTAEPRGRVWLTDALGHREIPVADRRHAVDVTVEAFTAARHGDAEVAVTGHEAVRALATSLAVLESGRTGRRVRIHDGGPLAGGHLDAPVTRQADAAERWGRTQPGRTKWQV